jgi:hypothetical protein
MELSTCPRTRCCWASLALISFAGEESQVSRRSDGQVEVLCTRSNLKEKGLSITSTLKSTMTQRNPPLP